MALGRSVRRHEVGVTGAALPCPLTLALTVRQHFICLGHLLELLLSKLFIIWVLVWVPL